MRLAGGKTADCVPAKRTDGPLSLTHCLASRLNKRLDSVRINYTLLDKFAEFSFVYDNNQFMLLYKKYIFSQ